MFDRFTADSKLFQKLIEGVNSHFCERRGNKEFIFWNNLTSIRNTLICQLWF
jgi:hypothetical protein